MNPSTQDRLKAFLGRNRARVSSLANEKEDPSPLEGTTTNDDNVRSSFRHGDNLSGPLSSRFPAQNQTMSSSNVFGRTSDNHRVNYTEGNEYTEEDSPQRQTVGDMRTSKIMQKSRLSGESSMSRTQRGTLRNEMTPVRSEVKRNYSTSPIRETRNSNKNMIESYVSVRKKVGSKIRDHLKSLSKDNKKTTVPMKSNSLSLNYQSSFSKQQLGITSDAMETQDSVSYRKQKTPVREKKDSMKADKGLDKSKKHNTSQRQPSSVFSSGVKRTKEEKHEYAFEEAPKVIKGNKTARDISRSMSRSISPTPKTVVKKEKKDKKVEKSQQVTQRQTADKSPKSTNKSAQQNDDLFPESSRRLQDLDLSTNSESKFKKEIQKLIEIIKSEKDHITKNLESMSSELSKYKTAYKKLKKKYQHQKEERKASAEKKTPRNNENILAGAEEGEAQNSFQGSAQYSSLNGMNKALSLKKHEENYVPFTIDELNKHLDSNTPVTTNENPIELLSKMNDINLDVQNIIAKTTQEENLSNRDSNYNSNFETHSFQLRRNPINCYIIKEMNLASHLFFQDALKEVEQDADFTPTVIDLLAAQREIIHFLIRKIEIEEKQRLKTEEQANQMVTQMEKTIKQLEEKGPGSRKRESTSTTELNKSTVSQNA